VGGVDGLVEADGRHGVAQSDERRLDGHLLDEERQAAGGAQQASYLVVLRGEVDLLATRGADPAEEELHGRALEGCPRRRHGQRADADHRLVRLAGGGAGGDHDPGVAGALQHRLQGTARAGDVEVEPVEHEQAVVAVHRAPERAGQRVTRRDLRVEAPQGGDQHVVQGAQAARVDPGRVGPGRHVLDQQRLPAAGRADHGDPPGLVQGIAQRALDIVSTEAG
jgi:hypothetical protein